MDFLNESQIVTGFISEILKTAYQGIRNKVKGEPARQASRQTAWQAGRRSMISSVQQRKNTRRRSLTATTTSASLE